MIVKDEERVLERCLNSFAPLVDEIVIVDTGSSDSTKAIAARYTDKLYDFSWTGNFSEARNFAFSKCSCEYIYSADADEMIDEENAAQFRILKEVMDPQVELVQMWYVNRHPFRTTENYEKDLRPKLFRRLREFVWIDPVHETVRLDPLVFDSDIEILHMPEGQHAGRDFSVFLRELGAGRGLSERLWHMYAQELFIAGETADLTAAAPYFEQRKEEAMSPEACAEACCVLAREAGMRGDAAGLFKNVLDGSTVCMCSELCLEMEAYYRKEDNSAEAERWKEMAEETEALLVENFVEN